MLCSYCGMEIPEDGKFCGSCGEKIKNFDEGSAKVKVNESVNINDKSDEKAVEEKNKGFFSDRRILVIFLIILTVILLMDMNMFIAAFGLSNYLSVVSNIVAVFFAHLFFALAITAIIRLFIIKLSK